MNNDRRSHEAFCLRAFFDDQLHHLQKLVISLRNHEQQVKEDRNIVENFVNAANSKMRAIHGYTYKLREPVLALYNHVLQVADEIPPPIDLNSKAFGINPLVNALFVNRNDIDQLLKADPDLNPYLEAPIKNQLPVLYALLTASMSEKRTLGVGMLGNTIIRDVPQQAINFSLHKIHSPCESPATLNMALKKYLFAHVVALAKQEMMSRMTNQPFKPRDDYESSVKSLANPEVYLKTLIQYLKVPANLLSMGRTHFRLSKLGIKLDGDDRQSANEFDIPELIWSNKTRNVMLKIALPR
jgi:small-conductance mechanosensitive channel